MPYRMALSALCLTYVLVTPPAHAKTTSPADSPKASARKAGAKDVAVEFFSMTKSYNMAGGRVGFLVGNGHIGRAHV